MTPRCGRFSCIKMRNIYWDQDKSVLALIDQRSLPRKLEYVFLKTHLEVAEAIRNMTVRGAPAIGAAAAFGMALAANTSKADDTRGLLSDLMDAAKELKSTRPTAVNLAWAVDRILKVAVGFPAQAGDLRQLIVNEAQRIADEDVEINKRIAKNGVKLINDGDTIIHHCNTGSLATVDWGTALGVIRMAFQEGKQIHVLVDETRPRLQGSRLTAWELEQYGIPYEIITDNMAGYFLQTGNVQKVLFGGDRVAMNGDVANKVGSYMLALAASDNKIPVYVVVPTSTIDLSLEHGGLIPIEERDSGEVLDLQLRGEKVVPIGAKARNPGFDITPWRLITAFITEKGIIYPPFKENISKYLDS